MTGVDPDNFENFRLSLNHSQNSGVSERSKSLTPDQTETCECGHKLEEHYSAGGNKLSVIRCMGCFCKKFKSKKLREFKVVGLKLEERSEKTETLSDKRWLGIQPDDWNYTQEDVKSSVQKILAKIDGLIKKAEEEINLYSKAEFSAERQIVHYGALRRYDVLTEVKKELKQEMGEELVNG